MKYHRWPVILIYLTLYSCESEAPNPIYLHENGVTIVAHEWAEIGDIGTYEGHVYQIVNSEQLEAAIWARQDVKYVCTSRVTNMYGFFNNLNRNGSESYHPDISSWDVSNVEDMRGMFEFSNFNPDLSYWDTSSLRLASYMFLGSEFTNDISFWDVSNVKNMRGMFSSSHFNDDISSWDVSNVVTMEYMFSCSDFNQDLSKWDVSKVTNCIDFDNSTENWTLPKPSFDNCDLE